MSILHTRSVAHPYVVDADDFCVGNSGLERLFEIRGAIPSFKITLFTIVGRCSKNFLDGIKTVDWIDLVPHGLFHETARECEHWTYEESMHYLETIEGLGLTRGFKAPGWQISDGMYRALLESNYWVADQRYNDARRPKELKAYLLQDTDGSTPHWKRHYHVQNVCGNGLEERLREILLLQGEFAFVKDVVN
jgi:hypothetical protein